MPRVMLDGAVLVALLVLLGDRLPIDRPSTWRDSCLEGIAVVFRILFSGETPAPIPASATAFFRGDRRREVFALVAINGLGARMALSSGRSSSDE